MIPLVQLLNGDKEVNALNQAKDLISKKFAPCFKCPFLQRASETLIEASKFFEDSLSVVLNDRFVIAARLHFQEESIQTNSPARNDYRLTNAMNIPVLSRVQLLEEARNCRTLMALKCTQMPFYRYQFLERFGIVMCMLGERREAIIALTEAIKVAIEHKLQAHLKISIHACPLVLQLLGDETFEFFLKLAKVSHKAGDSQLFEVCKHRAIESQRSDEDRIALQEFMDSINSPQRRPT